MGVAHGMEPTRPDHEQHAQVLRRRRRSSSSTAPTTAADTPLPAAAAAVSSRSMSSSRSRSRSSRSSHRPQQHTADGDGSTTTGHVKRRRLLVSPGTPPANREKKQLAATFAPRVSGVSTVKRSNGRRNAAAAVALARRRAAVSSSPTGPRAHADAAPADPLSTGLSPFLGAAAAGTGVRPAAADSTAPAQERKVASSDAAAAALADTRPSHSRAPAAAEAAAKRDLDWQAPEPTSISEDEYSAEDLRQSLQLLRRMYRPDGCRLMLSSVKEPRHLVALSLFLWVVTGSIPPPKGFEGEFAFLLFKRKEQGAPSLQQQRQKQQEVQQRQQKATGRHAPSLPAAAASFLPPRHPAPGTVLSPAAAAAAFLSPVAPAAAAAAASSVAASSSSSPSPPGHATVCVDDAGADVIAALLQQLRRFSRLQKLQLHVWGIEWTSATIKMLGCAAPAAQVLPEFRLRFAATFVAAARPAATLFF